MVAVTCSDIRPDRKRTFERMMDEVKPDYVYRDTVGKGSLLPWMEALGFALRTSGAEVIAMVPDDLYLADAKTDPRDVVMYMRENRGIGCKFFEPRNAHHAAKTFDMFSAPDSFTGFFGAAGSIIWEDFIEFVYENVRLGPVQPGSWGLQFDELVNAYMMARRFRCQHTSKSYVLHDNSVESADGNGHQDRENPGGIERVGKNPAKPGDIDRIGPVVEKLGRQYASNHHRFFWAMKDQISPSCLYEVERCR